MSATAQKPQHMVALNRANQIRLERAEVKRNIKDNDRVILRVLDDPPECVMTASITELLTAQRRWGRIRAVALLSKLDIRESRKVEDLTMRQREAIASAIEQKRSSR